jgi:hypothetical protein
MTGSPCDDATMTTTTVGSNVDAQTVDGTERNDILETLAKHRGFLRETLRGMTDEQAASRPTPSELCLGGIVKHVSDAEAGWARFIVEGPVRSGPPGPEDYERHLASFRMEPGETVEGLLARYDEIAAATDELVRTLPSLDATQPLPEAPWFPPGASWSARRALLHIVAETAQHAGHADIIREAIDGAKTMG